MYQFIIYAHIIVSYPDLAQKCPAVSTIFFSCYVMQSQQRSVYVIKFSLLLGFNYCHIVYILRILQIDLINDRANSLLHLQGSKSHLLLGFNGNLPDHKLGPKYLYQCIFFHTYFGD
jgi:hypothetical protein